MSKNKRHSAKWSSSELSQLRALAKAGKTSREAAKILGRTPATTRWKAMCEKVSFHSFAQVSRQKRLGRLRRKSGSMFVTL